MLTLVSFVERSETCCSTPVRVDFLDEAAWEEQGAIDEDEILDEDAQLLEHGEGMFHAVGLVEGDLDLLSDIEELGTSGTVGHYWFEDEVITIRGAEVTLEVQKTLVHELTHVLQDQHFDIGDRLQRLGEDGNTEGSLHVLVEERGPRRGAVVRAALRSQAG